MGTEYVELGNMPGGYIETDFETVRVDLFDVEVAVFPDREAIDAWMHARDLQGMIRDSAGSIAHAFYFTDPDGMGWFLAYIPKDAPVHTVSHECLHLAWYILEHHGVEVDKTNHEVLAYLQAFLLRKILSMEEA